MGDDDDDLRRDAVALFRPRDRAALEKHLEPEGFHRAWKVGPDAYLVHTNLPFGAFADGWGADELFSVMSDPETLLHDDRRGLLVFPASVVTIGATYDAVVAEAEARGVWVELEGMEEDDGDDGRVA